MTVPLEITLVMVTHDVHLRPLADRVIWMRDGRINRVEVTGGSLTTPGTNLSPCERPLFAADEVAKAEAKAEVRQQLAELQAADDGPVTVGNVPAQVTYEHTVLRTPNDYVPISLVETRKGRRELARRMQAVGLVPKVGISGDLEAARSPPPQPTADMPAAATAGSAEDAAQKKAWERGGYSYSSYTYSGEEQEEEQEQEREEAQMRRLALLAQEEELLRARASALSAYSSSIE